MGEAFMHVLLVVLAALSQVFYEAKVPTFGCTSSEEVAKLQSLRADTEAFNKQLYTQVFHGHCIPIEQGSVVDGVLEGADAAVIRVGAQVDPPGYMAPAGDFKPKTVEAPKEDKR
jgi:hypothetical protein